MHLIDRLDEEADWTTALSAGEQRRIGLARALILRPDVLLIDDADVTSDIGRAKDFYDLLVEQRPAAVIVSVSSSSALANHRPPDRANERPQPRLAYAGDPRPGLSGQTVTSRTSPVAAIAPPAPRTTKRTGALVASRPMRCRSGATSVKR
jgi:hypothetical protein